MTKTDNGKKYALIAAICFAIFAFYEILTSIQSIVERGSDWVTILDVLLWIAFLGLPIVLFMNNKKAVIAVSGTIALTSIIYFLKYIIGDFSWLSDMLAEDGLSTGFKIFCLCLYSVDLFTGTLFAALTFLAILSHKGNPIVTKIFVFLEVLVGLNVVFYLVHVLSFYLDGYITSSHSIVLEKLFLVIRLAGCFIMGLWLKADTALVQAAPVSGQPAPVYEHASFSHQAVQSAPAAGVSIGDAERLVMLKELLDSGVITQDEFDAKKKQVLGL